MQKLWEFITNLFKRQPKVDYKTMCQIHRQRADDAEMRLEKLKVQIRELLGDSD